MIFRRIEIAYLYFKRGRIIRIDRIVQIPKIRIKIYERSSVIRNGTTISWSFRIFFLNLFTERKRSIFSFQISSNNWIISLIFMFNKLFVKKNPSQSISNRDKRQSATDSSLPIEKTYVFIQNPFPVSNQRVLEGC